jgi:hypothetical protein
MSPSDLRHALAELARDADTHHPVDRLARVHRQARQTARTRAVAGATAAVVVVLGGTWALHAAWSPEALAPTRPGSTNHTPTAPPPSVQPTPTQVATPSPTLASSGPALVDSTCAPDDLSVHLGRLEGTAGSMYVPVVVTNEGKTGCRLQGYPAVALTATDRGPAIGPDATLARPYDQPLVRLAPGGKASALVQIVDATNFPPNGCEARRAEFLRFTPPGTKSSTSYLVLPSPTLTCSKPADQVLVRPVVAGETGVR